MEYEGVIREIDEFGNIRILVPQTVGSVLKLHPGKVKLTQDDG